MKVMGLMVVTVVVGYVVPRGREGGNARDPAGYARFSACRGVHEATPPFADSPAIHL